MEKTHKVELTEDELALIILMISTWEEVLPVVDVSSMKHEDIVNFSKAILPSIKEKIGLIYKNRANLTKPNF